MPKRPSDPQKRLLLKLDEQFRAWVQTQPSCISGRFSEYLPTGEGRSICCHVRRAKDSGTAWKPLFRAIPLTDAEHKNTHQHGESYYHPPEWFETQSRCHLERWLRTIEPKLAEMVREAVE